MCNFPVIYHFSGYPPRQWHWEQRPGITTDPTPITAPLPLRLKKPVLFLQAALWKDIECCAGVDTSAISDEAVDRISQPVMDHPAAKLPPPIFARAGNWYSSMNC